MVRSARTARRASQDLTRLPLVLAPQTTRSSGRLAGLALLLAATLAGAAAAGALPVGPWAAPHDAVHGDDGERGRLQQRLDETVLSLGLAQAHAQELERQIDVLNQRLRASQEELAFFRKARDASR